MVARHTFTTFEASMPSSNTILEITDRSFAEKVMQSKVPVLLAFCADCCAASQKLLAMLADSAPRRGFLTIAKVSLDESPELAARFGVVSVPAVLLFSGGTVCYQFVGELSRADMDELPFQLLISSSSATLGSPSISHWSKRIGRAV
jgi:thioredoxin 1